MAVGDGAVVLRLDVAYAPAIAAAATPSAASAANSALFRRGALSAVARPSAGRPGGVGPVIELSPKTAFSHEKSTPAHTVGFAEAVDRVAATQRDNEDTRHAEPRIDRW